MAYVLRTLLHRASDVSSSHCLCRSSRSSISVFYWFEAGVKARCGIKQLKGPSANQLCSKVQTCHSISNHLSKFTAGHWGSHTAAAAAVLAVGLGDPARFMHYNLLSSHWGRTLNDSLKCMTADAPLLSFLFSYEMPFSFSAPSTSPSFLVFPLIFLFLIKPKVPSK